MSEAGQEQIDALIQHYEDVLSKLKQIESKEENEEEEEEGESRPSELDEFRRSVCGCVYVPVEVEVEKPSAETKEKEPSEDGQATSTEAADAENNTESQQKKAELHKKTDKSQKLYDDLNIQPCSPILAEKLSKVIAEICKEESCRYTLVDQNMFGPLARCLGQKSMNDAAKIQICRAIANMCYYNDIGRLALLKANGLLPLMELCKNTTEFDRASLTPKELEDRHMLIQVVLGCLHNITNENETLRHAVFELNIMKHLNDFYTFIGASDGILSNLGTILDNLLQSDEGKEQFVKERSAFYLYKNLDEKFLTSLNPEFVEDFFSTLTLINEQAKAKDCLLETDFIETLMNKMENESAKNLRHYGLYLTTLLVKDENVDSIFEYRNNFVLNKGIDWLCTSENEQLHVASSVIIANYMRNDVNAEKCFRDKRQPHVKILKALEKYSENKSPSLPQINVIFSLLGALRNFCIPAALRTELLEHGPIKVATTFLTSFDNLEIKSKALSIIRLLIKTCTDKTGLDLVFSDETLSSLEKLAKNSQDHVIIAGESSRLVCYLPIAAKNEKRIKSLLKYEFIEVVCAQLKSEHFIMVNEAVLALNVLLTVDYRGCFEQLQKSSIKETFKTLFQKEIVPIEIRTNELVLFDLIINRGDFFTTDELNDQFLVILKRLENDPNNNSILKSKISQIISRIERLN